MPGIKVIDKLVIMNIIAKKGNIFEEKADLAIFGVFSGTQTFSGALAAFDKRLGGLITSVVAEEQFGGKLGDQLVLHTHGKLPASRILLVGLGDKKTFNAEAVRRAAGAASRYVEKLEAENAACYFPNAGLGFAETAQAAAEGALLADYKYLAFKPQEAKRLNKRKPATIAIMAEDAPALRLIEKGIALGEVYARATIYARDLVNEPACRLAPSHLRDHAAAIAANEKNVQLKVLDATACEKLGMGAFLAVAKGSEEAPYFLHLVYKPHKTDKPHKKIVLVGKAVTFDSGGLSLKPSEHMETMKCDMAGAAAVLGIFSVLGELELEVEVHGLIAACENMPSGKAMRPGDIVTAMNGKSIEILNTDAEGRLTLADALSYADKKIKPDQTVDLATLTGACMVALGTDIAAVMTVNEKLYESLRSAAESAGEPLWRLPLPSDYAPLVAGDHADLRNTSRARYGGAITAGLFLKEFAGEAPWAHLDIAGPAFAERDVLPYMMKGGTGYGVRTMLNWLKGI
jgi:leucyl aminopeptidase